MDITHDEIQMVERFSRRALVTGGLGALTSLALPKIGGGQRPGRPFRIAHITDIHLRTDNDTRNRFAKCLDKIQRQERPDAIFQGGDMVMDALDLDRNTSLSQFDAATRMFKERVEAPVFHCLGNHDVWAWNRPDRDALSRDPKYGKGMWLDWSGNPSTYYSFDRGGWHFVFLDSIAPGQVRGYQARLDEAQFNWLAADLDRTPNETPVCIVSHIPILSAAAQFFGPCEHTGKRWEISGTLLHIDARRLKDLFLKHPNVRLCLSGHIHMNSHIRYNKVAHISHGAVCGAWWNGAMQETAPGYGIVDLFPDGRFASRYETY